MKIEWKTCRKRSMSMNTHLKVKENLMSEVEAELMRTLSEKRHLHLITHILSPFYQHQTRKDEASSTLQLELTHGYKAYKKLCMNRSKAVLTSFLQLWKLLNVNVLIIRSQKKLLHCLNLEPQVLLILYRMRKAIIWVLPRKHWKPLLQWIQNCKKKCLTILR